MSPESDKLDASLEQMSPNELMSLVRQLRSRLQLLDVNLRTHGEELPTPRLLDLIYETMTDGVVGFDMHGRVLFANPGMGLIVGRPVNSLVGKTTWDAWQEEAIENLARLRGTTLELELTRSDGSRRIVAKKVFGLTSSPPMEVAIYRDITRRKRAERMIHKQEAFYRSMVEQLCDHIVAFTPEGICLYATPSFDDFLPETEETLKGKSIYTLIPDTAKETMAQLILDAMKEPGRCSDIGSLILEDREGGQHLYRGEILNLCEDTNVGGLILYMNRIEAPEEGGQPDAADWPSVQKWAGLGLLAGGVVHDLNNLLSGIMGTAGLAIAQRDIDGAMRETFEQIEGSAAHMARLLRQLLDYSAGEVCRPEDFDLNAVVHEMKDLLRASVERHVVLSYDLDSKIVYTKCDVAQFRQVVMNLVGNAGKAIGAKQGTITIRTGMQTVKPSDSRPGYAAVPVAEGDYVFVEIADDGHGIQASVLPRIFDPFFTTRPRGQGLGLAAVKRIVQQNRGGIVVETEQGRGARFRVFLPVGKESRRIEHEQEGVPNDWQGSGIVLVIDDEKTVREVAEGSLMRLGFTVITAGDGIEGVSIFRQSAMDIDVVLLDLTMPRMDGPETLRELRKIRPDVKVILMSGYSESQVRSSYIDTPSLDYLPKPFRHRDIAALMRHVMG